jgi:hypothetical protein
MELSYLNPVTSDGLPKLFPLANPVNHYVPIPTLILHVSTGTTDDSISCTTLIMLVYLAKVDFATKSAQMRLDFADAAAKQKAREQVAKENSSWGRRRIMALKGRLAEDRVSSARVLDD